MNTTRQRLIIGLLVFGLTVTSCTEAGPEETTTTSRAPFTTTPLLAGVDDPIVALEAFLDEANQGDASGAIGLFTDDARWTVEGREFALDEPLDDPLGTLAQQYGLRALGARGRDLAIAILEVWATLRTEHTATSCSVATDRISCVYGGSDARSALGGFTSTGTIIVELSPPLIGRLLIAIGDVESPSPEYYDFFRWASVEAPEEVRSASRVVATPELVTLLDRWVAGEGTVIPSPGPPGDPVATVEGFVDSWNSRDWPAVVALLDATALDSGIGTWDAFQGAEELRRTFAPEDCRVTLENEVVGAIVACELVATDILLTSAGITWCRIRLREKRRSVLEASSRQLSDRCAA